MFSIQGSDFQNDASKISSIMYFRFLQLGISDFFNVASAWISEKSALADNLDFYNVGNIFKKVITVLGKRNQTRQSKLCETQKAIWWAWWVCVGDG